MYKLKSLWSPVGEVDLEAVVVTPVVVDGVEKKEGQLAPSQAKTPLPKKRMTKLHQLCQKGKSGTLIQIPCMWIWSTMPEI
jgi:hypothetical protein